MLMMVRALCPVLLSLYRVSFLHFSLLESYPRAVCFSRRLSTFHSQERGTAVPCLGRVHRQNWVEAGACAPFMQERWASCLQQNGQCLLICRKVPSPAPLAYMSQDRHRRAKLSSSALERVLKQPKIRNCKLLRNFLCMFVCVHTYIYICVSICACHLFLIISPPSWLLKLGDYSVVRVG